VANTMLAPTLDSESTTLEILNAIQRNSLEATLDACRMRSVLISNLDRSKIQDEEMEKAKRILPTLAKSLLDATEVHTVGYALNDILAILRSKVSLLIRVYGPKVTICSLSWSHSTVWRPFSMRLV
jgi:hypothetical protein